MLYWTHWSLIHTSESNRAFVFSCRDTESSESYYMTRNHVAARNTPGCPLHTRVRRCLSHQIMHSSATLSLYYSQMCCLPLASMCPRGPYSESVIALEARRAAPGVSPVWVGRPTIWVMRWCFARHCHTLLLLFWPALGHAMSRLARARNARGCDKFDTFASSLFDPVGLRYWSRSGSVLSVDDPVDLCMYQSSSSYHTCLRLFGRLHLLC